ncbi:polysaccharide pyruvyl transferase family protein [Haloarcula japonica]|uniref:polysaccharide pyruvyl transferase family protein n=1 Tax=Haloarcula japonica TaxID=29282 RepID=UPI0039F68F73
MPHDIGIQGSYRTGNIGDRALGELFQREFSKRGYQSSIFDKRVEKSNSTVRILGGGGVLHDWYGTEHLKKRLNYISTNGLVVGVGVPGFESAKAKSLVKNSLSNVELITVRDKRSKRKLDPICDSKVIKTACPAFLYEDPETTESDVTGVNFRPWFNLDSSVLSYYFDYNKTIDIEKAKKDYIKNIRHICGEIRNPVFIPFTKEDEEFANKYLNIKILDYCRSVSKTLERVSAVKKMVSMRYHSLIFAVICEKPIVAIEYAPKVGSLTDRLNIDSYRPHGEIALSFERANNVDELKQDAQRNFDLAEPILESKIK